MSHTCVGWSEASLQNWLLHRTITRHFGEKIHWCFWTSSVVMKSNRSIRILQMSYLFYTITENVETCNCWLMNTSFAKRHRLCSLPTLQAIACCEKKKKSGVTATPLWKPWNLWHNRFCNFERVTISLYVQRSNEAMLSERIRATLCLLSSEQLQCCAHEMLKWIWWLVQRWTEKRKLITKHGSES